jgi:hypothetical protein
MNVKQTSCSLPLDLDVGLLNNSEKKMHRWGDDGLYCNYILPDK